MRRLVILSAVALAACVPQAPDSLIDRFAEATVCLPPNADGIWSMDIQAASGTAVRISGSNHVSGKMYVRYAPQEASQLAADPPDYIYPQEARMDSQRRFLYTRAQGLYVFPEEEQTWLFEYDLTQRRMLNRGKVDPSKLPPPCR